MKKTYLRLAILGVVITLFISTTYALWQITHIQNGENIINSNCFEITYEEEKEGISLSNAFPVEDDIGLQNKPYVFMLKNTCNGYASYEIEIDSVNVSKTKLPEEYLKVNIQTKNINKTINLDNKNESDKILEGIIGPNTTRIFEVRMWMDEKITLDNTSAINSEYKGKVKVTYRAIKEPEYILEDFSDIKRLAIEDKDIAGGSGIVKVSHEDANIVDAGYNEYDLNPDEAIANLKQEEYRYYGENPNNYVKFNNELWRIIGLVNTPEGQRVKIIRANSLEPKMSWDNKGESGSNNWSDAALQELLNNGAYYNRTSGDCPTGQNNATTPCDFSESGLTSDAKEMIDDVIWNLGGYGSTIPNTKSIYNYERGTAVYTDNNITRPKLWQGKIGLMYPSDYGYATSGESTNNRELCLKQELYNWKNDTYQSDCAYTDWLLNKSSYQWTLLPYSSTSNDASHVAKDGYVYSDRDVYVADTISPVLYLKPEVLIASGKGTEQEPYELSYKGYQEKDLNGTDPVLKNNLIPVKIDNEGKVTRADTNEKWYDYANQEWANAIILVDGKEDPGVNQPISEEDIESYFVWIPRYRYQIFSDEKYTGLSTDITNKVQTIEVIFEDRFDTEVSKGQTKETWLTHPAFTSFNTNGIWVGKFETGYKDANAAKEAEINPVDESDALKEAKNVIIKPNVYSWRSIQVSKAYIVGRNYESALNSHMMKNTEWGAVAYLQHSVYGSRQEVKINNNSSYLTGYAAIHEPTIGYTGTNELCSSTPSACNENGSSDKGEDGEVNVNYFNKNSVVASTTNNYTGIYDMSGGVWEYMMSGMEDSMGSGVLASGYNSPNNSGFNGKNNNGSIISDGIVLPADSKYYDIYTYSTSGTDYTRFIFGDAVGEMGPFKSIQYQGTTPNIAVQTRYIGSWYGDHGYLVFSNNPWVMRGGSCYHGTGSGIFSSDRYDGYARDNIGFRLVLAF